MADVAASPWMAPACPSSAARVSRSSLIISDRPVSMTCLRNPMSSIGWSGNRTPRSIVYGKWNSLRLRVEDADVDDLRVEDAVDLVADQVVHGLHVQLGRQAVLDAVDDRQLGGALVGLGQEALRLLEQPRVLERDAHARRQRAEQPLVGLAEGVRVDALEADDADDPLAGADRDAEPRLGVGPADLDGPGGLLLLDRPDAERPPRPDDGRGDARAQLDDAAVEPLAFVDVVREPDVVRRGVVSAMNRDSTLKIARTRSPTSSMMAAKSSCLARAFPMSLMTASSALRWSVSVSRRLVSSNRRALSSATAMLEASVLRSRSSDSS